MTGLAGGTTRPPAYADRGASSWRAKAWRVATLVRKETRQMIRDPSSIAIGVVLPLILILLFGFGLSLDVKNVPIALVVEESSPETAELTAGFALSPYFRPVLLHSMRSKIGRAHV